MIRHTFTGLFCAMLFCATAFADPPVPAGDNTTPSASAVTSSVPSPAGEGAAAPTAPSPATSAAPLPVGAPIPPDGPRVKIVTTLGTITLALDAEHAPATVKNFLRYAREGRYNGMMIYRVVPRFVVQMGAVDTKGLSKKPYAPVVLETANGLKNVRGAVAMARDEKPNSATTEFFIDLGNNTPLDAKPGDKPNTTGYAVFAAVAEGMDVVDAIAAVQTEGGYGPFPSAAPKKPLKILKVIVPPSPKAVKKK